MVKSWGLGGGEVLLCMCLVSFSFHGSFLYFTLGRLALKKMWTVNVTMFVDVPCLTDDCLMVKTRGPAPCEL